MSSKFFALSILILFFSTLSSSQLSPPSPSDSSPSPSPSADSPTADSPSPSPSPNGTLSPQLPPSDSPISSPPAPPPSDLTNSPPTPTPAPDNSPDTPSPAPAEVSGDVNHTSNVEADDNGGEKSSGLSGGKKAGIAVGVIVAGGVVGLGAFVYKKRQDNLRRSQYGYAARRELL
ncbi:vegetative cell wall protein gp1-like [Mercurialis annua]|uniref:vegetative cell wall protein gp1-like n=1 Tax=Mercurialis annua TaxID=3986 RepID=UPI00215F1DA5|nr:vegetative cell wall protein gp1-like [Mercurialis annua]